MDERWGRTRGAELLRHAAQWLDAQARAGEWYTLYARQLGGLALVEDLDDIRMIAARVLREAPAAAFAAGMLTNIPVAKSVERERELGDRAAHEHWHQPYGPGIPALVRTHGAPHVALVLEGRLDEAWASAREELDKEEHVATCAIAGHFARAETLLADPSLPAGRRLGPRVVLCIESHRRDDASRCRRILDELLAERPDDYWSWLHLGGGLLGREPWGGYPYPDY